MGADWQSNLLARHSSDARLPDLAGNVFLGLFLGPRLLLTINDESAIFAVLDITVPVECQRIDYTDLIYATTYSSAVKGRPSSLATFSWNVLTNGYQPLPKTTIWKWSAHPARPNTRTPFGTPSYTARQTSSSRYIIP